MQDQAPQREQRAARQRMSCASSRSRGGIAHDAGRALKSRRIDRFLPGDAESISLEVAADSGQNGGAASLTAPLIIISSKSILKNDYKKDSKSTEDVP